MFVSIFYLFILKCAIRNIYVSFDIQLNRDIFPLRIGIFDCNRAQKNGKEHFDSQKLPMNPAGQLDTGSLKKT